MSGKTFKSVKLIQMSFVGLTLAHSSHLIESVVNDMHYEHTMIM